MTLHPFPPLFDEDSRVLILGSFPSVKSREEMFFYGHRQNRFWHVLSMILGQDEPKTVDQKKIFLHKNHIALWDVLASCDIVGSADSSIKNASPNDLSEILASAKIQKIFVNGKTAQKYYDMFQLNSTGIPAICLPSTSPANAAWSVERLAGEWKIIEKFIRS